MKQAGERARLYAAKGRPVFNPLISHVADIDAACALADFEDAALRLACICSDARI